LNLSVLETISVGQGDKVRSGQVSSSAMIVRCH